MTKLEQPKINELHDLLNKRKHFTDSAFQWKFAAF